MKFRHSDGVATAAAKAGFSTATGYRVAGDPRLPSQKEAVRGRRRPDPLADIFDAEVVPLLIEAPGLRAVAVFEADAASPSRSWHWDPADAGAAHPRLASGPWRGAGGDLPPDPRTGPDGTVGLHRYGRLDVTVAGVRLDHRLYHFRLVWSGFEHAHVILGGESYVALAEGLQNALWALGGSPLDHRSDSLSAAFRNLDADARADLTRRYDALCEHYGMTPSRNNRGVAHENGSVESAHGHLKKTIRDALLMRGSAAFDDLAAYRRFIDEVIAAKNRRAAARIDAERVHLKLLPDRRTSDYEEVIVTVTLKQRLHVAQGVLHRPLAADRAPSAASRLY